MAVGLRGALRADRGLAGQADDRGQQRGTSLHAMTALTAIRTGSRSLRRTDVLVPGRRLRADAYDAPDPRLVVEVLSPCNSRVKRQCKPGEYQQLRRLQYLLLVATRAVLSTFYTLNATEWYACDAHDVKRVCELPTIAACLAMDEFYEGLSLNSERSTI